MARSILHQLCQLTAPCLGCCAFPKGTVISPRSQQLKLSPTFLTLGTGLGEDNPCIDQVGVSRWSRDNPISTTSTYYNIQEPITQLHAHPQENLTLC